MFIKEEYKIKMHKIYYHEIKIDEHEEMLAVDDATQWAQTYFIMLLLFKANCE